MKNFKLFSFSLALCFLQSSFADVLDQGGKDGIKKVLVPDMKNSLYQVCSVDTDGTLNLSFDCNPDLLTRVFGAGEIFKRKPDQVFELTTPLNPTYGENVVNVTYDHTLFALEYSANNGRSAVIVTSPTSDSPQKFLNRSGWLMNTSSLATEVQEVNGLKVGDTVCVKIGDHDVPALISKLFKNGQELIIRSKTHKKGEVLGIPVPIRTFWDTFITTPNIYKCPETLSQD
jgi:hypothetical protein